MTLTPQSSDMNGHVHWKVSGAKMCHFPFHNLHPPVTETEFYMSGKQVCYLFIKGNISYDFLSTLL